MGIFDRAKDALTEHKDKVDEGIAKISDLVDEKTGHKYSDHIDQGEALAKKGLDDYTGNADGNAEPGPDSRPV